MKLLFDENISFRIIKLILNHFPESIHVTSIKKSRYSDLGIWQYAKSNNFCIVTYDEDFCEWQNLRGMPPKIIWLRFGNARTEFIAKKIINNSELILKFSKDNDLGLLEIH